MLLKKIKLHRIEFLLFEKCFFFNVVYKCQVVILKMNLENRCLILYFYTVKVAVNDGKLTNLDFSKFTR